MRKIPNPNSIISASRRAGKRSLYHGENPIHTCPQTASWQSRDLKAYTEDSVKIQQFSTSTTRSYENKLTLELYTLWSLVTARVEGSCIIGHTIQYREIRRQPKSESSMTHPPNLLDHLSKTACIQALNSTRRYLTSWFNSGCTRLPSQLISRRPL